LVSQQPPVQTNSQQQNFFNQDAAQSSFDLSNVQLNKGGLSNNFLFNWKPTSNPQHQQMQMNQKPMVQQSAFNTAIDNMIRD